MVDNLFVMYTYFFSMRNRLKVVEKPLVPLRPKRNRASFVRRTNEAFVVLFFYGYSSRFSILYSKFPCLPLLTFRIILGPYLLLKYKFNSFWIPFPVFLFDVRAYVFKSVILSNTVLPILLFTCLFSLPLSYSHSPVVVWKALSSVW